MKGLVKLCLLIIFLQPGDLMAQKDSIRLICPLNDAIIVYHGYHFYNFFSIT